MINRRGITLVELLATLSLLTLMSVISVSWMTTVLRSQTRSDLDANWGRASVSVLDLIGRDVLSVDRLDAGDGSGLPRVGVEENMVRIRTRDDSGAVVHRYVFDPLLGNMYRHDPGGDRGPVILGLVEEFGVELELPSEQISLPIMRVLLVGQDGRRVERAYILGREDVQ